MLCNAESACLLSVLAVSWYYWSALCQVYHHGTPVHLVQQLHLCNMDFVFQGAWYVGHLLQWPWLCVGIATCLLIWFDLISWEVTVMSHGLQCHPLISLWWSVCIFQSYWLNVTDLTGMSLVQENCQKADKIKIGVAGRSGRLGGVWLDKGYDHHKTWSLKRSKQEPLDLGSPMTKGTFIS